MAKAVACCPHFTEFLSFKTGIRLTVNHRVKVRRTAMFTEKDKSGNEVKSEHVTNAVPVCAYTRKFD